MSKDFSCRTCGHLCTRENDRDGKAVIWYECELDNPDEYQIPKPELHFCADHTDLETVKRITEGQAPHAELLQAAKEMLAWWDHKRPNESAHDYINRLSAAIAKTEGDGL